MKEKKKVRERKEKVRGRKEKVREKKNYKWLILLGLVILLLGGAFLLVTGLEKKYNQAIHDISLENYDLASKELSDLGGYKRAKDYLKVIKAKKFLDSMEYRKAYDILAKYVKDEEIEGISLAYQYSKNGIYYNNNDYGAIYSNYKDSFGLYAHYYNEKDEEIVKEAMYNYAYSRYKDGYYGKAKSIFDYLTGYKDTDEILKDKYFNLLGKYFSYTVSVGYQYGMVSFSFYDDDRLSIFLDSGSLLSRPVNSGITNNYNYQILYDQIFNTKTGTVIARISSYSGGDTLKVEMDGYSYTLKES